MAKNNYLQSQEILKRCFVNVTGKLKSTGGTYTTQDYLNAVYDESKDSLRIIVDGGGGGESSGSSYWGEPVNSVSDLPITAEEGTITPVITEDSLSFYLFQDGVWKNLFSGSGTGSSLTSEEKEFINWGIDNKEELEFYIDHKDKIEELLNTEFAVKVITVELLPVSESDNIIPVNIDVNGNIQNIVDENDSDGDLTTHYKIDVDGYVIGLETYENSDAVLTDRYFTKEVYEKDLGPYGITHIYMTTEEYNYFSGLKNNKNVLKIAYLESMFGTDIIIKKDVITVPDELLEQGVIISEDLSSIVESSNYDEITHYRYRIDGYIMSIETYSSNNALKTEEVQPEIIDYNEGDNNVMGYTDFYLTKSAYESIETLQVGKNIIEVYYLYQTK